MTRIISGIARGRKIKVPPAGTRPTSDRAREGLFSSLQVRFGFEGEPWTLEAIGHELDLTRERVRQLEGQALKRLEALRDLAGLAACRDATTG